MSVELEDIQENIQENLELITEFWGSDSGDSDVYLSEGDFEDESDDDLFAEIVDHDITNMVAQSLVNFDQNTIEGSLLDVGEKEGEGSDIHLGSDEDLNDSDDELLSVVGSDDEGVQYPVFNPDVDFKDKIKLTKGLKFSSNIVFRKALRHHAIENGYNYYFLHNGSRRVSVYCAKRCGCKWKKGRILKCNCTDRIKCKFKVHCKKLKNEETFQIKSLRLDHICGHQHVNPKVTSQYIAEKYLEDYRENPNINLTVFSRRVRREVKAEVGYYKLYYARMRALRMIHGDTSVEYKRVWDYVETIRKYYPGSTAKVKLLGIDNPPPMFQRMYVCLQPCKEGFIAGCRPLLGMDGCHLRGPYPGILLTAVGKDGNNNIFPVAWAVVEIESSETWTWFLNLLVEDLGSVAHAVTWVHKKEDDVTFMSDRQKGLLDAFKSVIPNSETRYCCRHIWANFKKQFNGELYREKFWKAARASTKHEFEAYMGEVKELSEEAFKYLNNIPACHWSRHAFSTRSKSGMLVNNCCESFNNVLREARTMPILSLMEWIRRYVMIRCCSKRDGLKKIDGEIMPSVVKMIHRGFEEVNSMRLIQADLHEFEVDHNGDTYVVNLEQKVCGCYRWNLMGIPCWHALACISKRRLNYEDFMHPAYRVTTYAATYAPKFNAMPGQKQWEKTPFPEPLPPHFVIMPGRPSKKKRKKEQGEDKEKQLVKRAKKQNNCGNCGRPGH